MLTDMWVALSSENHDFTVSTSAVSTLIPNRLDGSVELREVAKANCGAKKWIISKHEVRSESIQMWKNEIAQYTIVRAFYRAK
jgi:hypothetical protein